MTKGVSGGGRRGGGDGGRRWRGCPTDTCQCGGLAAQMPLILPDRRAPFPWQLARMAEGVWESEGEGHQANIPPWSERGSAKRWGVGEERYVHKGERERQRDRDRDRDRVRKIERERERESKRCEWVDQLRRDGPIAQVATSLHCPHGGTAQGQGGDANLMQPVLRRCAQFPYAMMPRTSHSEAQFDKKYFRSPQLDESEECKVHWHFPLLFSRLSRHQPLARNLPSVSLSARLPHRASTILKTPPRCASLAHKAWPLRSSGATSRLLQA